jgi:hypothetical protein
MTFYRVTGNLQLLPDGSAPGPRCRRWLPSVSVGLVSRQREPIHPAVLIQINPRRSLVR